MRCVILIVGLGAALAHAAGALAQMTAAEIVALDAKALRDQLAAGGLTAERVTEAYLEQIARLDDRGPKLAAVIEVNPDALSIARALDRRHEDGNLGSLHGVPVLIKANIDTADRMATSAGSLALAEHHAAADADVVAALRAAGAVILGKTNLSEWANFRSPKSTSGWSSLGGQTRNAYVLDRNPCGSSSGSAVAVAARLAPLAIGTETDGSIVCPAAANGVVGIKPTIGLVSQRGIVPIAASQDTAGPMARNVADAAMLLGVISGGASGDAGEPGAPLASLRGVRVGVVSNYGGAGSDAAVERAFAAALSQLRAAGATLVDGVDAGPAKAVSEAERTLLVAEFRDDIDRYLANVEQGPRSLAALIEFDTAHADTVMPYFGQELFLEAQAGDGRASETYRAAVETIRAERSRLARLFATNALDVLVAPTNGPAWRTALGEGDAFGVGSSRIAAVSGYPSVTVPMALAGELPLGIAFIGKPRAEARMLAIAAAYETRRGAFPAPRMLASVPD